MSFLLQETQEFCECGDEPISVCWYWRDSIFSRDEKKQDEMLYDFQVRMPDVAGNIKLYIADVSNRGTLK